MADQPSYYAIIPANVRYDKDLCANAKLLYGEITALAQSSGKCFASNDYFAKLYDVSKQSISKWIKSLCEKGYISSELIYKQGTKEILHRYITLVVYPPLEKLHTPPLEKFKDNNTSINNTRVNKDAALILEFKSLYPNYNNVEDSLLKFIAYRKSIKKPIKTPKPLKLFIDEMIKCLNDGYIAKEVFELMEAKEWQSISLDWVKKSITKEKDWNVVWTT